MEKIVILYSGGLDSLAMWRRSKILYPGAKVVRVFYDIGQPYLEKELKALPRGVIKRKVDWLSEQVKPVGKGSPSGDIFIPGRNLVLAVLAACQELPDQVWVGALAGETRLRNHDKNDPFCRFTSATLSYVLQDFVPDGVDVVFPLQHQNKLQVVQWLLNDGVTPEELHATSSCLSGEPGKCGRCVVCLRRWGIFTQLGIPETYNVDPLKTDELWDMVYAMQQTDHYDKHRKAEILPACEMNA